MAQETRVCKLFHNNSFGVRCFVHRNHGENSFHLDRVGGDCVEGSAPDWQQLQSDGGPENFVPGHKQQPCVAVSLAVEDTGDWNGMMRIVPYSLFAQSGNVQDVYSEVASLGNCVQIPTLKAGQILIRDVKLWHGGCPNPSSARRVLPCLTLLTDDCADNFTPRKASRKVQSVS